MTITWLGHSCFLVEAQGFRIVLDPFRGVRGLPDTRAEAHLVLCSHDHFDHNYVQGVTLLPQRKNPFAIRTVATCHDDAGGSLRGPNTVHILSCGGVTLAHMGDLGHVLMPEQAEAIGRCDAILLPVGGTYTVDSAAAYQVAEQLQPQVVVPMHYRRGDVGLKEIDTVDAFLARFPAGMVHTYGASLELRPGMERQVAVMSL